MKSSRSISIPSGQQTWPHVPLKPNVLLYVFGCCHFYNCLFLKGNTLKFSSHGAPPELKSSRWFISYSWCHQKLVITVHYLCLSFKLLSGSLHFELSSALRKSICSAMQTAWRGFRITSVYKRRGLAQPHQNTYCLKFVQDVRDEFKQTKAWFSPSVELFTVAIQNFQDDSPAKLWQLVFFCFFYLIMWSNVMFFMCSRKGIKGS